MKEVTITRVANGYVLKFWDEGRTYAQVYKMVEEAYAEIVRVARVNNEILSLVKQMLNDILKACSEGRMSKKEAAFRTSLIESALFGGGEQK